ncbi:hypothetical protein TNCV_4580411 [Trichonephila clavipes]|nr:hypothetical protein TNCV_4580411 [Trichonephila clavipes]
MSSNPYDAQVGKFDSWTFPKVYMDTRLLDLKNETGRKKYGYRKNINDLYSIETAVRTVYFHLLSSNESPQHEMCPAVINAWYKFQKTEAESKEMH